MMNIQRFVFNAFMVNTYLLYDTTGECVVIDAACYEDYEKKELEDFIRDKKLRLVRNINTHCHVDHVLGNEFISAKFGIRPEYHAASAPFFISLKEVGNSVGFIIHGIPEPGPFIKEGDMIRFGNSALSVIYTPGHADGSVCLYCKEENFVVTGDVLFRDTIGRTDLPSGDFDLLMKSIREKLFSLPPDTIVLPGHGPETTIGYEMTNNPFIR